MALFPEIEADVETYQAIPPPRRFFWLVIACHEGVWDMPTASKGLWHTREAAEKAASKLSTRYWQHVRLVGIPGEGSIGG